MKAMTTNTKNTNTNKRIRFVEASRFSDHACVEDFNRDIESWCREEGGRYVIFQFGDLTTALSPQLGLVASTHRILIEHGGTAVVTGASRRIRAVFDETNLSRFIPLVPTDEEAQQFLTKIS